MEKKYSFFRLILFRFHEAFPWRPMFLTIFMYTIGFLEIIFSEKYYNSLTFSFYHTVREGLSTFMFNCWFLYVYFRNMLNTTHYIYERTHYYLYRSCLRFSYKFTNGTSISWKIDLCANISICTEFFLHSKKPTCTL